jgi:Ca2+/H+ antiporter
VARRILWASLVLTPVTLVARFVFDTGATTLFILSALALIPLAWLIVDAHDHAAEHTGPGIGRFLNRFFYHRSLHVLRGLVFELRFGLISSSTLAGEP